MANKRISSLDDISLVGGTSTPGLTTSDIIPVTDVSDTTGSLQGTTKKVTVADLLSGYQAEPAEGAFVDGDKTKLDGIEASADVTDATNVQAAGALMDNEVTNLAQVKAFDSSNYATSAQGTLADSALQSVSAGDLTDGNFDGEAILGFKASLPTEITAATYTVQDSDNGQVIRVNHATGCTVTIPSGLFTTDSTGFNCSFIQVGAGQITFDNDGTSVINNRQSHTKTNAQWAAASVVSTANNVFVLAGDTAS
jgi:hypothetical protein